MNPLLLKNTIQKATAKSKKIKHSNIINRLKARKSNKRVEKGVKSLAKTNKNAYKKSSITPKVSSIGTHSLSTSSTPLPVDIRQIIFPPAWDKTNQDDAITFVSQIESAFELYERNHKRKLEDDIKCLRFISSALKGEAANWAEMYHKLNPIDSLSWAKLSLAFTDMYLPMYVVQQIRTRLFDETQLNINIPKYDQAVGMLRSEYIKYLPTLIRKNIASQSTLVHMFIQKLGSHLKTDVLAYVSELELHMSMDRLQFEMVSNFAVTHACIRQEEWDAFRRQRNKRNSAASVSSITHTTQDSTPSQNTKTRAPQSVEDKAYCAKNNLCTKCKKPRHAFDGPCQNKFITVAEHLNKQHLKSEGH